MGCVTMRFSACMNKVMVFRGMCAVARSCANNLYPAADMEGESTRHHRPAFHKSSTNSSFICRPDILLISTSGWLPAAVLIRCMDVGHAVMPSAHKHPSASIFRRTFIGITNYPAQPKPGSDPNLKTRSTLQRAFKVLRAS